MHKKKKHGKNFFISKREIVVMNVYWLGYLLITFSFKLTFENY